MHLTAACQSGRDSLVNLRDDFLAPIAIALCFCLFRRMRTDVCHTANFLCHAVWFRRSTLPRSPLIIPPNAPRHFMRSSTRESVSRVAADALDFAILATFLPWQSSSTTSSPSTRPTNSTMMYSRAITIRTHCVRLQPRSHARASRGHPRARWPQNASHCVCATRLASCLRPRPLSPAQAPCRR